MSSDIVSLFKLLFIRILYYLIKICLIKATDIIIKQVLSK